MTDKSLKKPRNVQKAEYEIAKLINNLNHDICTDLIEEYSLSKEQADFVWTKYTEFDSILMQKYGADYFNNAKNVASASNQYVLNLIKRLQADIQCPPAEEF